jgi:hypothetical protein
MLISRSSPPEERLLTGMTSQSNHELIAPARGKPDYLAG